MSKPNPAPGMPADSCPSWCTIDHQAHNPSGERYWRHENVREVDAVSGRVFVKAVGPAGDFSYVTLASESTRGHFLPEEVRAIAQAMQEAANDIDAWDDARCDHSAWDASAELSRV